MAQFSHSSIAQAPSYAHGPGATRVTTVLACVRVLSSICGSLSCTTYYIVYRHLSGAQLVSFSILIYIHKWPVP